MRQRRQGLPKVAWEHSDGVQRQIKGLQGQLSAACSGTACSYKPPACSVGMENQVVAPPARPRSSEAVMPEHHAATDGKRSPERPLLDSARPVTLPEASQLTPSHVRQGLVPLACHWARMLLLLPNVRTKLTTTSTLLRLGAAAPAELVELSSCGRAI